MDEKITGYKYDVVVKPTILLMFPKGGGVDEAEDVDGFNVDLVKYEVWSDGDIVPCNTVSITGTTVKEEAEYLKDVVKTSAVFMAMYQDGLTQSEARELFKEEE